MVHRMECYQSRCCIGVDFACSRCGTMERSQGWCLPTTTDGGSSILVCASCRDDYERCAKHAAEVACLHFVSAIFAS